MEKLTINTRVLSKLSLIINKMGISSLILELNVDTGNEQADKQEVVKKLLALIADNVYKAEDELISLIAIVKGISVEDAENVDVIDFIKELLKIDKISSFLK